MGLPCSLCWRPRSLINIKDYLDDVLQIDEKTPEQATRENIVPY